MTPDLPPIPPGAWLPRLEAARRLGVTERTLQRRMKQGLVMARHDEHNRVQVYVPDGPDTRHDSGHDMAMTTSATAIAEALLAPLARQAREERVNFLARTVAQEAIIRQQAEEIGTLRAQLAAHRCRRPWWRALWVRLAGREP